MRHDWIFDMLSDLHDYACRNDLPDLARQMEDAIGVARREIGAKAAAEPGARDPVPILTRRRAH